MVAHTLTGEQEAVVGHRRGSLVVTGPSGSGKTTALLRRSLALWAEGAPARVLVLARDRAAAERFVQAGLAGLGGGFDSGPVTTFHGLAFDLLRRAGVELRLLTGPERWAFLRDLLRDEAASPGRAALWPSLHPYLERSALVDEIAGSLLRVPSGAAAVGEAAGTRWAELAAFAGRYESALRAAGLVDSTLLLATAAHVGVEPDRFEHVLVDDFESATAPAAGLLDTLAPHASTIVVAGNPGAAIGSQQGGDPSHLAAWANRADAVVELSCRVRPAPERGLVRSHHPALEPETVASLLLEAHAAGVAWADMGVVVRRPRQRARALVRALGRHGIPVAAVAADLEDEPVVAGLLDLLRWAAGDERAADRLVASALAGLDPAAVEEVRRQARAGNRPVGDDPRLEPLRRVRDDLASRMATEDPASLAHRAFRSTLGSLVGDPNGPAGLARRSAERALDAVVALLDGLDAYVGRHPGARLPGYLAALDGPDEDPDPWLPPTRAEDRPDAVGLCSLATAAGREWDTVIVAGCVEGELPRWPRAAPFFDPARLDPGRPGPGVVRARALAEERRLFGLAEGAARRRILATAGPEPGQLLSRFVEDWPTAAVGVPTPAARAERAVQETVGPLPVWPEGSVPLSASRLTTYDDCPLKFAFTYGLKVRDAGNVWASLGTMFHAIVAEFLGPASSERSHARLLEIAENLWTDDVARYRPQREEVRRDLFAMLDLWFEREIGDGPGPEVLAVEREFAIGVGPHVVNGVIDRIDRVAGGIEIIDYKTGRKVPKPDEVADDLQLAVYHLAAERDAELVSFGPPRRLVLRYVRTAEDREQPITADHALRTEERILAAAELILAEAFEPAIDADCDHCTFHRLCPLQLPGREVTGS